MSLIVGMEDVADLPLPVQLAEQHQVDVADHLACVLADNGEVDAAPAVPELGRGDLLLQHGPHLLLVTGLEVEPADDVGAGLHRQHRAEVVLAKGAQQQPIAFERVHGGGC